MNFVNMNQSREERQFKYVLCRLYFNSPNAYRMRDFTFGHIAQQISVKIIKR